MEGDCMGKKQVNFFSIIILLIAVSSTSSQNAVASIVNNENQSVGTILFHQTDSGMVINFDLQGLPEGMLAVHIHNRGQCDPPEFSTAGEHFNPSGKQHGFLNSKGFHAGDLPNIKVDSTGNVKTSIRTQLTNLIKNDKNSLLTKEGTSIVIHAGVDDYITSPSGGSGKRIACGAIKEKK
jgi:Cu-Zn family superoxide dismutase